MDVSPELTGAMVRVLSGQWSGRMAVVSAAWAEGPDGGVDDGLRYSLALVDANGEYVAYDELEQRVWRTSELWPVWMDQTCISVYANAKSTVGKVCWLSQFLRSQKFVGKIEQLRLMQDAKEQKRFKTTLPMATMSGVFGTPRSADRLQRHSGVMCIDIDPDAANTERWGADLAGIPELLRRLPWVAYYAHSCRGVGYFAIVRMEPTDKEGHRRMFRWLQHQFRQLGVTIDSACSDVSRARFLSYDAAPWWRLYAPVLAVPSYEAGEEEGALDDRSPAPAPDGHGGLAQVYKQQGQQSGAAQGQQAESGQQRGRRYDDMEWITHKVDLCMEEIELSGRDITGTYDNCLVIGAGFYTWFGAAGLDYWKRVCRYRGACHEQMRTAKELAVKWASFRRMNRMSNDMQASCLNAFFASCQANGIRYTDAIERQKRERRYQRGNYR